eukprot:snap_masked-scaffold_2-processed-gene-15.12-mRNA-1 protein AED:1.00 eAED:1.00 QI:0/-1/0/0/-1/1/1/0/161
MKNLNNQLFSPENVLPFQVKPSKRELSPSSLGTAKKKDNARKLLAGTLAWVFAFALFLYFVISAALSDSQKVAAEAGADNTLEIIHSFYDFCGSEVDSNDEKAGLCLSSDLFLDCKNKDVEIKQCKKTANCVFSVGEVVTSVADSGSSAPDIEDLLCSEVY